MQKIVKEKTIKVYTTKAGICEDFLGRAMLGGIFVIEWKNCTSNS